MKSRFSTIDISSVVNELQKCIGMRVNQIYDVDNKTYLIRLNRYEEKVTILIESGIRIHTTDFEWPKNPSPSGFSMKMRKHLKNKRLEKLVQLGLDRIIELQFGINEAAYHIILELYDRGNIVLTDYEYTILNILRPRAVGCEDVKFLVREKYPIDKAQSLTETYNKDEIYSALNAAKDGDVLRKVLMPHVTFGPALLDHIFLKNNFPKNCAINKHFKIPADIHRLFFCLEESDVLFKEISKKPEGYVIQKVEKSNKDTQEVITNIEFHPYLFGQFSEMKYVHYPSFDKAVDDYFSSMEGQKIDLKALQKEREAMKKLENVKKDHEQRVQKLQGSQVEDMRKAQLIEMNLELVDKAIMIIRSAVANQISWSDIEELVKEAQLEGDPVAKAIKKLKLNINHFTLLLSNPLGDSDEDESKPQMIDIDLDCSAYANARKYYDMKRAHAKKEQKTLESSEKAFKSAEKKTKQTLKEVAVATSIIKARKVMWFEKFLWFISSENYLVIAGRDVQQNELLVKKYLKASDLYVHADLHGASSVVIKNPLGGEVPPKTLNEAGTMAVCNSTAWDAKIVTSAWWVYANQVSKTAPSGEYLTTGSFMIRGKKNYLTPASLIMGFGFLFKLDDESIQNHVNERCVRNDDTKIEEIIEIESKCDLSQEINSEDNRIPDDDVDTISDHSKSSEQSENESDDENDLSTNEKVMAEMSSEVKNSVQNEVVDNLSNLHSVPFPDTEVKLNVFEKCNKVEDKEHKGSVTGIIIQEHEKKAARNQEHVEKTTQSNTSKEKQQQPKRGHKGKLKKIKEKYKYQDEEERELRMKILASAGQPKEDKKSKKKSKNLKQQAKVPRAPKYQTLNFIEIDEENTILNNDVKIQDATSSQKEECTNVQINQDPEVSEDEVDDDVQFSEELKLLNSLTGCPLPDDTLLFAVPVCGAYSAMLNYKYKVKIIPGSTRRGKAAKTALQVFLHEKNATQREKDLLKSVKDQDISRNLPGKVKISAGIIKKGK